MKKFKALILIISFILLSYHAKSQKYVPALIIIGTDTIEVEAMASDDPLETNLNKITFIPYSDNNQRIKLAAGDFDKVIINGIEYENFMVSYDSEKKNQILRLIVSDSLLLYEGISFTGKDLFFIRENKGDEIYFIDPDGIPLFLLTYFDKKCLTSNKLRYDAKSITNLIHNYSDCLGSKDYIYIIAKTKPKIILGFIAGLDYLKMRYRGETDFNTYTQSFVGNIAYHGGLTINLDINGSYQVESGVIFSMISSKTEPKDNIMYDFTRLDLEIPLLFRYQFRNRYGISPYFNLGPEMRVPINSQLKTILIEEGSESEVDASLAIGFLIGFGVSIPFKESHKLLIDLRYSESISDYETDSDNQTKIQNQIIGLSVGFQW